MARTKRKAPLPQAAAAPERRVYKAGGYGRLSVEDSGKPGADTIEAQIALITGYIEDQPDMRLCGVYSDNGRSGSNFDRPGFERLMEDVKSGKIDCIVVKDLSRFGRNYLETGNYLEKVFPFLDVRFVAVNDHFDTLTAERSEDGYLIPLKNILNDVYSKDISRKIMPALEAKRQRGEFMGSWAPYGYRKSAEDHHRLEPDEETAPIVRQMFQWRLEGMSYNRIARRLQEQGIPSPGQYLYAKGIVSLEIYANSRWSVQTVKTMLTREVYIGHMVQGRKRSRFSQGQKQQMIPKSQWTVVPHTHEPLVDEAAFRAVQKMAEERVQTYQERLGRHDALGTTPNILRGLVFCADCGRPLVRYKSVTNNGTHRYYVFICQTHSNDPTACPKKYLHESELMELLWNTLQCEIALAGDIEKRMRRYVRSQAAVTLEKNMEQEADAAKKAYLRAKTLYDSLYQNYVDRLMTEREYMELKGQYREEMTRARERLDEAEKRRGNAEKQTSRNPWLAEFQRYQGQMELTEEMAHALVERVEVDAENHVSITLRCRNEYRTLLQLLEESGEVVSV